MGLGRKKNGFDQRDVRRTWRRILIAIWLKGSGGAGRPWMWERDLREELDRHPNPPGDQLFDLLIRQLLHPAVSILERSGSSRRRGIGLRLTGVGAGLAKDYCDRTKVLIGKEG